MSRYTFLLWIFTLVVAGWITLACGNSPRRIQSITVSPATAQAQSYLNGQVPFVATGYYNSAPTAVTPLQANWGAAAGNEPANGAVTVDSNGMAQCAAGVSGTYSVGAWVNLPVNGTPPCPSFAYGSSVLQLRSGNGKAYLPIDQVLPKSNGDTIVARSVRSHRFRKTIEKYRILQLIGDRVGEEGYSRCN